jgi:hypothetical protein
LYNYSHSITPIGEVSEYIKVGRREYRLSVYCFATSGYYEGANLDWVAYVEDQEDGYEFELGEESVPDRVQKMAQRVIEKIEGVYAKVSTPMTVTARFSNGETMYSKA